MLRNILVVLFFSFIFWVEVAIGMIGILGVGITSEWEKTHP